MEKLTRTTLHAPFLAAELLTAAWSLVLIEDAPEGENFYCFVSMWVAILLCLAQCVFLLATTSTKATPAPKTNPYGRERRQHERSAVMHSIGGGSNVAA